MQSKKKTSNFNPMWTKRHLQSKPSLKKNPSRLCKKNDKNLNPFLTHRAPLENTFKRAFSSIHRTPFENTFKRAFSSTQSAPMERIVPRYWTGKPAVDPKLFTIDCSAFDARHPSAELKEKMEQTFQRVGLVHCINTGLGNDMDAMRHLAGIVVKNPMVYKGGANSRKYMQKNVYDTGAPRQAHLHYHHEMAYVSKSTKMLAFCCGAHVEGKGETYFSWNDGVTDRLLHTSFGQKLKEKGICYVRKLTDAQYYKDKDQSTIYNHWQTSFGVDDPKQVEQLAKERGLKIQWEANRLLVTKFYVSAFEYDPYSDRNVLYSSVADDAMWFDAWPGIAEVKEDLRPLKLTFGDDTEMTQAEKQLFVDVYDEFGIPLAWKTGDVAIACNYRFAHGRPAYALEDHEERVLGVVLGETFDRVGQIENKWRLLDGRKI